MYERALASDLKFFETPQDVLDAAISGRLKMFSVSEDLTVDEAVYPFVLPRTLFFANRIAAQYHSACGERIVVTSGTRPREKQPRNAVRESVHPTGMAVDFRRPSGGCLTWVRSALIALEGQQVIEASEEHHPPHFHVAVLADSPTQYAVAVPPPTVVASSSGEVVPPADSTPEPDAANAKWYRVKSGDTLWDIARTHTTTVARLKAL